MREQNYWNDHAEAMELSLNGNRLIAQELAEKAGGLWKKVSHALVGFLQGHGQRLPRA